MGYGYMSREYALSQSRMGTPVFLEHCRGWLVKRHVNMTDLHDAAGCYPLFLCERWDQLHRDIDALREHFVSISLAADPLANCSATDLLSIFGDACLPYKSHSVVRLASYEAASLPDNHQRNIARALRHLAIRKELDALSVLDSWIHLYDGLIRRHAITGPAAFSRDDFALQFQVPGAEIYSATLDGRIVGIAVFYCIDKRVYYHLAAYDDNGYRHRASFGIFATAIADFRKAGYEWLNLGGNAGLSDNSQDGLARFKQGWANDHRTAFFCGKILMPDEYKRLSYNTIKTAHGFFPAYRVPKEISCTPNA